MNYVGIDIHKLFFDAHFVERKDGDCHDRIIP
jgi:hypothetical protein